MRESPPPPIPNVLVVDDDRNIVGVLRRILELECHLCSAAGVREALEVLDREGPFAVVMTDYRMPGTNGTDLILKARKAHPQTVFVVLTGTQDDDSNEDIQAARPFRVLSKPCQIADIRSAVADAIQLYAERTGVDFGIIFPMQKSHA